MNFCTFWRLKFTKSTKFRAKKWQKRPFYNLWIVQNWFHVKSEFWMTEKASLCMSKKGLVYILHGKRLKMKLNIGSVHAFSKKKMVENRFYIHTCILFMTSHPSSVVLTSTYSWTWGNFIWSNTNSLPRVYLNASRAMFVQKNIEKKNRNF